MLLNGNPPRNKRKPRPKYKVSWMGSKNLNQNFEKYFFTEDDAIKDADKLDGSLVLEHKKSSKDAKMFEIVPTENSMELLKNIAIVRKIKDRYANANGESTTVSTQSFEQRQRTRLLKGVVIAPFMVYTGATYKLPNIFRVGLVVGGVLLGLNELKFYFINKKLQKTKI